MSPEILLNAIGKMFDPFYYTTVAIHLVIAVVIVYALGWGGYGIEKTQETLTVKLPGGSIAAHLPVWGILIIVYRVLVPAQNYPQQFLLEVVMHFTLLQLVSALLAHVVLFVGSLAALAQGLELGLECVDGRIDFSQGKRGLCVHGHACGAFSLLTLQGFNPLLGFAFLPIPDGVLGWVFVTGALVPVFFITAKLIKNPIAKFVSDVWMLTESIGALLAMFTASLVTLRFMHPNKSEMKVEHSH